ncbi:MULTISPECIES: hypothetical protein [unclassified Sphingobium]|uniref:phage tail assembly protein T n=1 Tax=unclassified Sphingobium TaxID=2611147 RepID=UPI002224EB4F|nr:MULTISPECIES: hypothetical protein [unclassified Sphingobium]MCW2412936.1 hypothetical protein [Sphingobium sp. B8D3D]MCW2414766.1 hypothetical protein [Sphingobium sp. B8D3A]
MENPERLFMHRLALALGKSLTEIADMTTDEFASWYAYAQLEPFGSPADDYRASVQSQLFWQANTKPGTGPMPDYYNHWPKPQEVEKPKKQKDREVSNSLKGFFAAYNERHKAANPKS